jgi:hypothetical protein
MHCRLLLSLLVPIDCCMDSIHRLQVPSLLGYCLIDVTFALYLTPVLAAAALH